MDNVFGIIPTKALDNEFETSWYLYENGYTHDTHGRYCAVGKVHAYDYIKGYTFGEGDLVTVIVDLTNDSTATIAFLKNGDAIGDVHTIPRQAYHFAVDCYDEDESAGGTTITIVEMS